MRLFVAIALPAAVIDELSTISLRLRSAQDGLRWSAQESWHITLQFVGNSSQELYECIVSRLRELKLPPVPIQLDGLGVFERVGVLFAGVTVTPKLRLLQEGVTKATEHCGVVPETRPFQPHITLARIKARRLGFRELKARLGHLVCSSKFVATEFLLYESFLGPAGARHEIRERFPLKTDL
jgi:RNA 2',3'-cyclic 3'-phosphodiesterase